MPALFALGNDLIALNALLDETDGEIVSPEAEAAFDAWALKLEEDEGAKLDAYVGLIRTLEGEEAVAKAEAEQFAMKARSRANRVKWLKSAMLAHLQRTGRTKVETAAKRVIAIQANGGKLPLTLEPIIDLDAIDPAFVVTEKRLNRDAVHTYLNDTKGATLPFARLEPRGNHLRIK